MFERKRGSKAGGKGRRDGGEGVERVGRGGGNQVHTLRQ